MRTSRRRRTSSSAFSTTRASSRCMATPQRPLHSSTIRHPPSSSNMDPRRRLRCQVRRAPTLQRASFRACTPPQRVAIFLLCRLVAWDDVPLAARAVVTLSKALYERVLRDLLMERAEYAVELYEGAGSAWTCTKCGMLCRDRPHHGGRTISTCSGGRQHAECAAL